MCRNVCEKQTPANRAGACFYMRHSMLRCCGIYFDNTVEDMALNVITMWIELLYSGYDMLGCFSH